MKQPRSTRPRAPAAAPADQSPEADPGRRRFLGAALASSALAVPALTAAPRVYAAPGSTRFLLVFMRGGYDCANLLVPWSSSFYYESRPHIAIAAPRAGAGAEAWAAAGAGVDPSANAGAGGNADADADAAVKLDAEWALAPAVRDTLGALYGRGQAAFIPFAGTDDLSRSHFETQDNIELGQPLASAHDLRSGFMARLAGCLQGAAPIAFTDSLPLAFKGEAGIASISLQHVGRPVFDDYQRAVLDQLYAGTHLQAAVAEGLELRAQVSQAMQQEMRAANRGAIGSHGFELTAERMAWLMQDRYRLGFVDVGGWDTHVNEGGAHGQLAANLSSLGSGLATFAQALGPAWNDTVVVVLSEFGRTFRQNGDGGTDHGHGSVYWVLGGGIKGGRIAGEQVPVSAATLFQNRDYPVLNNYRAVLAGLFGRLWGLSSQQLDTVFPGAAPQELQLV